MWSDVFNHGMSHEYFFDREKVERLPLSLDR